MHDRALPTTLIWLGVALVLACIVLLAVAWWHRCRARMGLPGLSTVRVIASDTGVAPPLLLRDERLGLRGKPDYLVAEGAGEDARILPVELKPQRRATRLYESDEIQLGAYLVLTRAVYGDSAARHGYVQYAASTFRVELTPSLERRIVAVAAAIRAGRRAAVVHRSHDLPAKCAGCPMRARCDEALV